ncbi:hypothetical protein CtesDRAFT_PD0921 [Comamonas testosteroni KF-1]|uniref:Uncharacterized protein n=1 Tax=Comamonas testosteroni (strain DSM 14576 / KF-1) TaxID=399795 RepID=B7WXF2_COMTK|nr:hypothetical protein CtesDRAFT_PD0921 [Comamonas testosteroni KF-1]
MPPYFLQAMYNLTDRCCTRHPSKVWLQRKLHWRTSVNKI